MRLLVSLLPLAACAAMTLRCRWMDRRGHCELPAREVDSLRAEIDELRAMPVKARARQ